MIPLVSAATAQELIRVLAYPKFRLARNEIDALLGEYLPFAEVVDVAVMTDAPLCRDPDDQMFVDLALQGRADVLVTGDVALLDMHIGIAVKTPREYAHSR